MSYLKYQKAVDLLHVKGSRLMLMHSSSGQDYFIVPGGKVDPDDAKKLLARPDVIAFDDGLFPGCNQTWRIER